MQEFGTFFLSWYNKTKQILKIKMIKCTFYQAYETHIPIRFISSGQLTSTLSRSRLTN